MNVVDPGQQRTPNLVARVSAGVRFGRRVPVIVTWAWPLTMLVLVVLALPLVRQLTGIGAGPALGISLMLALLVAASVLLHELGHVVAARFLGYRIHQVRLTLLGGSTEPARTPAGTGHETVIAAAGPVLSILAGLACWAVLPVAAPGGIAWLVLMQLVVANLVLGVVNLFPALPLDGGRILRAVVWRMTGVRRRGTLAGLAGALLLAVLVLGWSTWQVVRIAPDDPAAGWLQAGIGGAVVLSVLTGAAAEHRTDRPIAWSSPLPLAAIARPVVVLPVTAPLRLVLQAAGHRVVVLRDPDGVTAGLLDPLTVPLRTGDTGDPATSFAQPLPPAGIVLPEDDPAGLRLRLPAAGPLLLLVDPTGEPVGVVDTGAAQAALTGR